MRPARGALRPRTAVSPEFVFTRVHGLCLTSACQSQILAVVFGCLSLLIVWAEATIVSPTDISPLSLMIKDLQNSELAVQLFTLLPLVGCARAQAGSARVPHHARRRAL
jgi:hypothetical protein